MTCIRATVGMQKTVATWVFTKNPPCNNLQRSYYTVDGLKQKKLDEVWVAQVFKKHYEYAVIVKTKFMETDGSCDNNFLKGSHGCERIWENLRPEIQCNALYYYDIVKLIHRSSAQMSDIAELLWKRIPRKSIVKDERNEIDKFMATKRFMGVMVEESMSDYKKALHKASTTHIPQDSVIGVRNIQNDIIDEAYPNGSTGLRKRSRFNVNEIDLNQECEKRKEDKGKNKEIKIEDFDGSYECLICSKSVRTQGPVLACSQCSSNPFHESCVKDTKFMKSCPQCGCETVVSWKN